MLVHEQNVSERSVQQIVIDFGFRSRRPTRVPLLTERITNLGPPTPSLDYLWLETRCLVCLHLYWVDGRVRVWRELHETMDHTNQHWNVQVNAISLMAWGVCRWLDMGFLIHLETTLTDDWYISMLSHHIHPFMSIVYSDGVGQFQQGNATSHTSRVATEWLKEHSLDIRHFHWLPKYPDINIIEHIWDAFQCAVKTWSALPNTSMDMWTTQQDSWCELPPRYLQTLV